MKPNEDRVTLKPVSPDTKTASGLIIPSEAQKIQLWEIVAIGPSSQVCKTCGTKRETEIKPGMLVLINETAGLEYDEDGEKFRVIRFADIHLYDHKK